MNWWAATRQSNRPDIILQDLMITHTHTHKANIFIFNILHQKINVHLFMNAPLCVQLHRRSFLFLFFWTDFSISPQRSGSQTVSVALQRKTSTPKINSNRMVQMLNLNFVTPDILRSLLLKPNCSIRQKTDTSFQITSLSYKYSSICVKNN